jgi:protein Tex
VHPEAYPVVGTILRSAGGDLKTVIGNSPLLRG